MKLSIALSLVTAVLSGCQQSPLAGGEAGQVRHILVCELKPGVDAKEFLQSAARLRDVDGVVDYSAGERLPNLTKTGVARELGGDSVAVIVMTFKSTESLTASQTSNSYVEIAEQVLQPMTLSISEYNAAIERYDLGAAAVESTRTRRTEAIARQKEQVNRRK